MFRVSNANDWYLYPPTVTTAADGEVLYPGALPIVQPGRTVTYTTSVTNAGRLPIALVQATLQVPQGWSAKATTTRFKAILPGEKSFRTTWQVAGARTTPKPAGSRSTRASPSTARTGTTR